MGVTVDGVAHRLLDEEGDAARVVDDHRVLAGGPAVVRLDGVARLPHLLEAALPAMGADVGAAEAQHGPAVLLRVRQACDGVNNPWSGDGDDA